jgi:hypothetical protein
MRLLSSRSESSPRGLCRESPVRIAAKGENYARVVNFDRTAGLFCETPCFGVPSVLPFLQFPAYRCARPLFE